jgi:hypothetical protein
MVNDGAYKADALMPINKKIIYARQMLMKNYGQANIEKNGQIRRYTRSGVNCTIF